MESAPTPDARLKGEMRRHRDLLAVRWMGEQYAARIDHLQALLGRSEHGTHTLVRELRDSGYVRTSHLLVGEPTWVTPTKDGLERCGLDYNERMPRSTRLAVVAAINEARLHVQSAFPQATWTSERQLSNEHRMAEHMPDGLVSRDDGLTGAIMVETEIRRLSLIERRLRSLEPHFDLVGLYCVSGALARVNKLTESGEHPKLRVVDLAAIARSSQ